MLGLQMIGTKAIEWRAQRDDTIEAEEDGATRASEASGTYEAKRSEAA